ncbi:MAG: NTP transferase domain-containing protein, partial [Pseudomonadales bacterium]|nr:NTP transferase domain-containing protein [Pseudomonadales bacterium]
MLYPIILAGGVGARLWPSSRSALPKQFVNFSFGEESLFGATLNRLTGVAERGPATVVCNSEHRFLVAEQLKQFNDEANAILLEPVGRNTAPAIAVAALHAQQQDPDARLLVLPADHVIEDVTAFRTAVAVAIQISESGKLVTFGIVPGGPETGYGYIQQGVELESGVGYEVARFVEKPDLATAET